MTKHASNECPICKRQRHVVRVGVTSHCVVCDVYWPSAGPRHPIWGPGADKLKSPEAASGKR